MLASERIVEAALTTAHRGLVFVRNQTLSQKADVKCINSLAEVSMRFQLWSNSSNIFAVARSNFSILCALISPASSIPSGQAAPICSQFLNKFWQALPNYSVKWTAATCHGNLMLTVAAATYLKR